MAGKVNKFLARFSWQRKGKVTKKNPTATVTSLKNEVLVTVYQSTFA